MKKTLFLRLVVALMGVLLVGPAPRWLSWDTCLTAMTPVPDLEPRTHHFARVCAFEQLDGRKGMLVIRSPLDHKGEESVRLMTDDPAQKSELQKWIDQLRRFTDYLDGIRPGEPSGPNRSTPLKSFSPNTKSTWLSTGSLFFLVKKQ